MDELVTTDRINTIFGQVRAEYEGDDSLYNRFTQPNYFKRLLGITPSFLVGGRGTGKTTTLRSMSHAGQRRIHDSREPEDWDVVGVYWKFEPSLVSVFSGKGVSDSTWTSVFEHYLNLKLSSEVVRFAEHLMTHGREVPVSQHHFDLFQRSMNLPHRSGLSDVSKSLDFALVEIESLINGGIRHLTDHRWSVAGLPLNYLFQALGNLGNSRERPFMFCLDEYENLSAMQQRILNTLIKQVGVATYTFKIGVRNTVSIDRETQLEGQPIQDPSDFTTVEIAADLEGVAFEIFAEKVIVGLLGLTGAHLPPAELLPSLEKNEEALLLGADILLEELSSRLELEGANAEQIEKAARLTPLEQALVVRWSDHHRETPLDVLKFAMEDSTKWRNRVNNYGTATLYAIKEKRVGIRKYYTGWSTYCLMASGNIRYLVRLVHECLRLHIESGRSLSESVAPEMQTRAAQRIGESTIKDLQGWSKRGAELVRLTQSLGAVFREIAREKPLATPEVSQFRVKYTGVEDESTESVGKLLSEAEGQGVLISFDGDKNARNSGATRQLDYQLHPVLSAYFTYSPRSKRRLMLPAAYLLHFASREPSDKLVQKVSGSSSSEPARERSHTPEDADRSNQLSLDFGQSE
ncbi:hypothetical protein [Pseudoclavibacter sp. RFBB5]|uniref:ORC-CDC6 family AAA ATPase n=1 Tax=Pseudoclavibacter sp. RFBB5 TaxID=2080574 RepID=UPI0011AFF9EA|nr:hypothetical protein [Pseudoclavibacter sp. RFBB5]